MHSRGQAKKTVAHKGAGLFVERKVDFVDSRMRLGNAQTSLKLHSLLPRFFCGHVRKCA